jgi:hypothetical protein
MNIFNEKKDIFNKFSMYFHSTLRNIGLFTSLAFGSLAYSRYYRHKSYFYNIILILISLIFLSLSFIMNYTLRENIIKHSKNNKLDISYIFISNTIFLLHGLLILLSLTTLSFSIFD